MENEAPPRLRLYDAAARWLSEPRSSPKHLIDVAVGCLVDDLDAPSLRILAGASASDTWRELEPVLIDTLDELAIPRPDPRSPGQKIAVGGVDYARLPTDALRLDIVPVRSGEKGFEVLVYVDELEITSHGAGMGVAPFDLFVPTNQLVATTEPREVVVARCECGEAGCDSTQARIVRDGGVVHWDWSIDVPLPHGVTFPADQYDAEVARIADDRSWQGPADAITRLVLERVDRAALAVHGFELSWAAEDYQDATRFQVALFTRDEGFQVFLRFPIPGRSAEQVADDVVTALARPPKKWRATFRPTQVGARGRPAAAGWRWRSTASRRI